MAKSKAAIGLSWEPKSPAFSSASKNRGGSGSKPRPEANPLWKPSTQLVDGLFVPPNDPIRFDMPAPTMTPELQKDLQSLKVGTVIESPLDFFSSRLTNKERKVSLAEKAEGSRDRSEKPAGWK